MQTLVLIPVDDSVVFPNMSVTLAVDVGDEERVVLVPRKGDEFASVGTIVDVGERIKLPGGARAALLNGVERAQIGAASSDAMGVLRVEVTSHPDDEPVDGRTRNLEREYRAVVEELLELRGDDGRVAAFVRSITEPGALADTAGYSPELSYDQKVELLETLDVTDRLEKAVEMQRERLAEMQVRARIRDDVQSGAEKQQREYFLRKQMESIRKELGEDEGSVVEEYRTKIEEAGMPDDVREQAERELDRLERMGDASGEASMIRTYLDWLVSVPWSERSDERLDPVNAREVLDADHAGLEDVKDRIVEYIAVRKLRQERGIAEDKRSGAILTLIGPPGTGKTSIGESIARATGREFVRMSLGGVRDEAEIRGHRRTYIGALPGRLVRALRDAGTMNPVIMLDEVDKVGADWRGDPARPCSRCSTRPRTTRSATTTWTWSWTSRRSCSSPPPTWRRRSRRRCSTAWRSCASTGTPPRRRRASPAAICGRVSASATDCARTRWRSFDDVLRTIVTEYTHEAGVRGLERELGTLLRKTATRLASGQVEAPVTVDLELVRDALGRQRVFHEAAERTAVPGVATGLSVTGAGGDVLFIEATSMKGKEDLVLTGQLGDVMKESARIALSYVRGHADELGVDEDSFDSREFHVHVPAGAIPKDGPSAGVTMTTALASLLSGRPGAAHGGHDRRGDAPGARAADRRAQAEGARGARGRSDRRDPSGAQPG